MKVSTQTAFAPITLSVTFESEEEYIKFYSVLNYSPICEWAPLLRKIRNPLPTPEAPRTTELSAYLNKYFGSKP